MNKDHEDIMEAFDYIDGPPEVVPPGIVSGKIFGPHDVEKVEHKWYDAVDVGEWDPTRYWVIVGKLKDKRWFSLHSMCDGSEWFKSGESYVSDSLENIIRFGLSDEDRKNLKLQLSF